MKQRIALPLLLCAILAGCGVTQHGPLDPALTAASFPHPMRWFLAGVHMDQIRTTPIYLKLSAEKKLPRVVGFSSEVGFDPAKDVNEVLLASDGQNVLAIMHGDFKAKRPVGLESTPYNGYTLYIKDPREAMSRFSTAAPLWAAPRGPCGRPSIDQRQALAAPLRNWSRARKWYLPARRSGRLPPVGKVLDPPLCGKWAMPPIWIVCCDLLKART